jgi:hypothetical protein
MWLSNKSTGNCKGLSNMEKWKLHIPSARPIEVFQNLSITTINLEALDRSTMYILVSSIYMIQLKVFVYHKHAKMLPSGKPWGITVINWLIKFC